MSNGSFHLHSANDLSISCWWCHKCITQFNNCGMRTWKSIYNSLDINFIHGHIHICLCKKVGFGRSLMEICILVGQPVRKMKNKPRFGLVSEGKSSSNYLWTGGQWYFLSSTLPEIDPDTAYVVCISVLGFPYMVSVFPCFPYMVSICPYFLIW